MTGYSLKEISTRLNTGQIPQVAAGKPVYTQEELVGAIGNINSPLLDMPLKNSLAMKSGVGSATFTRATTATYIDRYGVLKVAQVDEPRFEKEGYLNEGDSRNLLLNSNQFNAEGGWTASNSTTTQTVTGPDVVTNSAWYLDENTTVGSSYIYKQSFALTAGTTYTASFFAKKAEDSEVFCWFSTNYFTSAIQRQVRYNFDTKVLTDTNNNLQGKSVVELANGWVRISMTFLVDNSVAASAMVIGGFSDTNTTSSGLYIFGAQLEALPFATSYIPTGASAVTRSADILKVAYTNNAPDWNSLTFSADVDYFGVISPTSYHNIITCNDAGVAANLRFYMQIYGGNGTPTITGAARWGFVGGAGLLAPINTKRRYSISSSNTDARMYSNGLLYNYSNSTDRSATITGHPVYIMIGNSNSSNQLYGHISYFRVWEKTLAAQEEALA